MMDLVSIVFLIAYAGAGIVDMKELVDDYHEQYIASQVASSLAQAMESNGSSMVLSLRRAVVIGKISSAGSGVLKVSVSGRETWRTYQFYLPIRLARSANFKLELRPGVNLLIVKFVNGTVEVISVARGD